jgi:potassium uptake protein, TrkH family
LDALFTATSATCVTGLVVVDTGTTFSYFGELIILTLIQIGGLGFMTFATFLFLLLGKRISLRERLLLKEAINEVDTGGLVRLAKRILLFTFLFECAGALLLSLRFSLEMPAGKAIYYGFFHSISNFNNAGFDIFGNYRSLTGYVDDPVVVLTVSSLIVIGGLGFMVVNDLYEFRKRRRLYLHTKVVLWMTAILVFGGTLLIFFTEFGNPDTMGPLSPLGKVLGALYQSVTTRTAGSNTLPIGNLRDSTLFFMAICMMIGAGSGSTAGGIKVSTFSVLLAAVKSQFRRKGEVVMFGRSIEPGTILKALAVTFCGISVVIVVTMLLSITDPGYDFLMYLFEAASAFGTVGLTMGLTPALSTAGRIILILTMFIGRLGPLTIGIALTKRAEDTSVHYPKGNILIG